MGKIRIGRKVFHSNAPKKPDAGRDIDMVESANATDAVSIAGADKASHSPAVKSGGIFSNVEIPPSSLLQNLQLPDASDRMSVISSITSKKHINKKDRRTLKREAFLLKLEATKALERQIKAAEKRKKTPVVGDMSVLGEALPTLEHLLKKNKNPQRKEKPYACKTSKQKQKILLEDKAVFQQVLNHPAYMKDPFGTISAHVRAALEAEKKECT